jgi:hypothetical protein
MRANYVSRLFLSTVVPSVIFSINIYAVAFELDNTFQLINDSKLHTKDLDSIYRENLNNIESNILIAEQVNTEMKESTDKNDDESKKGDLNNDPENSRKPDKEKLILKTSPVQFCQGKYKKMSGTGFEFITVKCPSVDSTCSCDLDIKGFREWVDCGGKRKPSTKGSDFVDCRSVIIGN